MRFTELKLDKFGSFESVQLPLDRSDGLTVIYGPNEAGKSTCLAAISDFLFGVPNNSPHGHTFGYPSMRIGATIRMSDGTSELFTRRKGNTKTLTNAAGAVEDDAALIARIGGMSRERFLALFGLDHATLRLGGERLLAADGDIGKLIVEAGGGLRSLVDSLDSLRSEVESLFTPRRAAERAFYKALDEYEDADKVAKSLLVTREMFEQSRERLEAARNELEKLREGHRELFGQSSRLERLIRVIPLIATLKGIEEELSKLSHLPPVRGGFPNDIREGLRSLRKAEEELKDVETKCEDLARRIALITPRQDLLDSEALILDIDKKATIVEKARGDRANRHRELEKGDAQLRDLKRELGLADDVELKDIQPDGAVLDEIQELVPDGIRLQSRIKGLKDDIHKDEKALEQLTNRLAAHMEQGHDEPFGILVAELGQLPQLSSTLESKRKQEQALRTDVETRLQKLEFGSLDELISSHLPDVELINAEIQKRQQAESEAVKLAGDIRESSLRRDKASAEIERLEAGGIVPSVEAITTARSERDRAWHSIRASYIDPEETSQQVFRDERIKQAETFETKISEGDSLADLRNLESDRLAELEQAQKQVAEANLVIKAAQEGIKHVEARLQAMAGAWDLAWPEAVARESDLSRLKQLVDERSRILVITESATAIRSEAEHAEISAEPKMEMLLSAETRLKLPPEASLAMRVEKATQAIKQHEDGYEDFRNESKTLTDKSDELDRRRDELAKLESEYSDWQKRWEKVMMAIALTPDTPPKRGNKLAGQWAAAGGVISLRDITLRRLSRMDDDERELQQLIESFASCSDLQLPEDSVATAELLAEQLKGARSAEVGRVTLTSQLEDLKIELVRKTELRNDAQAAVDDLCKEAMCDQVELAHVADEMEERERLAARRQQFLESIDSASDGFSLENLVEQQEGRDLDEIRTEAEHTKRLIQESEQAIADANVNVHEFNLIHEGLNRSNGINKAVAERERATSDIHRIVDQYLERVLATEVLSLALERIRNEQQDPLLKRAGELFRLATCGGFDGIATDVDKKGAPVVVGRRPSGSDVSVDEMSDGTRDQLFLAFRIAAIEHYCQTAEPIPFVGDDLLVHFDDDRSSATLDLLIELGKSTQVLLFTHHKSVRDGALSLGAGREVSVIDLTDSTVSLSVH